MHFISRSIIGFVVAGVSLAVGGSARAAAPGTGAKKSGYIDKMADHAERVRIMAELQSADPQRVSAAMAEIRACSLTPGHPSGWNLDPLVRVGRAADVEPLAIEGIIKFAHSPESTASFELARFRAFLADRKFPEAEGAAKAYYNLVRLKDTSKAVTVVRQALVAAHPDDPDIVNRFMAEQLAGTDEGGKQPATRPDASGSVLASVHVDGSPFDQAIKDRAGTDYHDLMAKGNLLLAADRAKEARTVFEAAIDQAGPTQLPMAVENVARAIRAESGEVAPANAYLASLSKN